MKNSSKQSVKIDMLHGSLFDKMLMFAMPLAACSILQQLFNSVGTAVVGRFASSKALAAVGSNSSVIALMVTLFSGISLGSNVVIANYIGQNDTKRIPRVVHTAVSLALLSGVFLLILGQFVAHPILLLMGARTKLYKSLAFSVQWKLSSSIPPSMPSFICFSFMA